MGLVSSLDPLDLLFGSTIGAAERKEGTRQVEFGNPFSLRQCFQVFFLSGVDCLDYDGKCGSEDGRHNWKGLGGSQIYLDSMTLLPNLFWKLKVASVFMVDL